MVYPWISKDILCISSLMDIHGISLDIPCIYQAYEGGLHTWYIPGIFQAYTENRGSRWICRTAAPPASLPVHRTPGTPGIVRRLKDGKAPGCNGFRREFYKYGPPALIVLLQAAINAFIAGLDPTVNPEE
jgi:hypothetical protein